MNSELVVSTVSTCCWETVAISERMFGSEVIDIDTASGLTRGLCKAFSTQGIKCYTVDRRLCINTSQITTLCHSLNYVH